MTKYGLGRNVSPFDHRDYSLTAFMPRGVFKISPIAEMRWDFPSESLNQNDSSHCTGFSAAAFGICSPINDNYTNDDGHRFYYLCKVEDGEPNMENGSNIRSVAKVLRNVGRIDGYAFAPNVDSIKWWVLNKGPLIVGTIWMTSMFEPDENGIIQISGSVIGGHAYLIDEYRKDGYFGFQNSWGDFWGEFGRAYISVENFGKIFRYGGEALTSVELPLIGATSQEGNIGCLQLIANLIKGFFSKNK